MRSLGLLCLAAALPAFAQPESWTPLFDGKTLAGWKETAFTSHGKVRVENGSIILGAGYMTGITRTGDFPTSGYEIRFEAARLEGSDFFATLTFPVGKSHCSWVNGGWGGAMVGLSSIDHEDASENETSTSYQFETGRWYAFRLRVTGERIQAWIDNELMIDLPIKGRHISLRPGEIDLSAPLGIASYSTVAGLRKIEYRLLP